MANDFYFNPIERVAGIADSCGMQIMSSTRRPYAIALQRTFWKQALTCAPSRFCLGIGISKRPRSICTCRTSTSAQLPVLSIN